MAMNTEYADWTLESAQRLREYLARPGYHIPSGLGTKEAACSLAAINLALTGRLTDDTPECMSQVVGRWIVNVQDSMPAAMRNSAEWRELLPLAAGTGREHEQERLDLILDWMWSTVLPSLQPQADADGYGDAWRTMCEQRTAEAAEEAAEATRRLWRPEEPEAAAETAASAARGPNAARAAAEAADVAAWAAWAADVKEEVESEAPVSWAAFNPVSLLRRLVEAASPAAASAHRSG